MRPRGSFEHKSWFRAGRFKVKVTAFPRPALKYSAPREISSLQEELAAGKLEREPTLGVIGVA